MLNTTISHNGNVYHILKLLGKGAYASCYLVKLNNSDYAMKIVDLDKISSEKVKNKLRSEIEIHSSLSHPNIVKMFSYFKKDSLVCMVLELCEKGALDDILKKNKKINEKITSRFLFQILSGISYLNNERIIHRDLKLGNLFLDKNYNIKIGDFGLSARIEKNEKRKTICGTPNYIAPEILGGKHSYEVDIWSIGVIMYTLLIGVPPFQEKSVEEIYERIKNNEYIFPENSNLSSEAISLIESILNKEPCKRLSVHQIMKHRFITKYNEKLLDKENTNNKLPLAHRIYKNLVKENFSYQKILGDFVVYSFPLNCIKGVGYILRSGVIGVFYQNLDNVFLKKDKLIFIKTTNKENKKIFITEDFSLPKSSLIKYYLGFIDINKEQVFIYKHLKNIFYFIKNFTSIDLENYVLPDVPSSIFLAKIKRINKGLLFIMTNNIFVFDFTNRNRVILDEEGKVINVIDEENNYLCFKEEEKREIVKILSGYIKM